MTAQKSRIAAASSHALFSERQRLIAADVLTAKSGTKCNALASLINAVESAEQSAGNLERIEYLADRLYFGCAAILRAVEESCDQAWKQGNGLSKSGCEVADAIALVADVLEVTRELQTVGIASNCPEAFDGNDKG